MHGTMPTMNILIMAPNFRLMKTSKQTVSSFPYNIKIVVGDLQDGLRIARSEIFSSRIDVIISRGGTATLLRDNLNIPVFDIHVSGYDLLRAIQPHAARNQKIAVVGYDNVISGARSIASILNLDLGYFQISHRTDLQERISEAEEWGADIVIGDTVSVKTAREQGLDAAMIDSGPEAISAAIESSVDFFNQVQNEMIRNRRLNLILEHGEQGVLYINSSGTIELANSRAVKMLGVTETDLLGADINSDPSPPLLAKALASGVGEHVLESSDKHIVAEIVPVSKDESGSTTSTLVFLQSSGRIRNLEVMIRKQMTAKGLVANYTFDEMVSDSPEARKVILKARKFALTESTILLLGETGVGKEFFAQSIHNASTRRDGPFVAVNCAALPDSLLESELFGYADGAFTGARKGGKPGLFEMAHLGTIFLDEINDLNMNVQARFLRVLQEKQLMRVGDDRIVDIDVRVIAASNKDLLELTENGAFRKDLYYRLRVLDIKIPPLRERRSDIVPLVTKFAADFLRDSEDEPGEMPSSLIDAIVRNPWPGNIRQLRNFIEKVCILSTIDEDSDQLIRDLTGELQVDEIRDGSEDRTLEDIERDIIREKWESNKRNISATARDLGLNRATVRKKLRIAGPLRENESE